MPPIASALSAAKLRRPSGLTPEQEARWWDTHPDYWDQHARTAEEVVHPEHTPPVRRTRPVNLRLPVDLIDSLKREAQLRDLPYQTLIRVWLREQLDRHAATPQLSETNAAHRAQISQSDKPARPAQVAETRPTYRTRKPRPSG